MNDSNWFAVIGLVLDIVGTILIFKYGLPSKVKEKGSAFGGTESSDQERARLDDNKRVEFWARIGLSLLIAGFIFQLIANLPFASCSNIFPTFLKCNFIHQP